MTRQLTESELYQQKLSMFTAAIAGMLLVNNGAVSVETAAAQLDTKAVQGLLTITESLLEQVYGKDRNSIDNGLRSLHADLVAYGLKL